MTASWFADKIEQWPTAKLLPYARNARTHSDDQVAQIAASIAEFGFTNPILAGSDGVIVAGHKSAVATAEQAAGGQRVSRRNGDVITAKVDGVRGGGGLGSDVSLRVWPF